MIRRFASALAALTLLAQPGSAAQTYIVKNDYGGVIQDRMREFKQIRKKGLRVEVRGRVCMSSCTMFIGLPDVCVDPKTIFGFHGPRRTWFRKANPVQFAYYSDLMASYYPEPLKSWFMETARHRMVGVYRLSGQQLIDMGVPECT